MQTVTKEARTQVTADPAAGELEAINSLNGTSLTEEEVYLFAVRLCDNQTDRDMEYFGRQDLEVLAPLFVGKTGIFDHSWSARDQTARIYRTEVVEEPALVSEAGEPGCYLKGYAYMLRTAENAGLIAEIEGGIKKEVSVSCAVSGSICSICGNDIHDRTACSHVKGRVYEGRRCIVRLAQPTDAFEWSFVAVPAQPRAGVVKSLGRGESLAQVLAGLDREGPWQAEWKELQRQAAAGRRYLEKLRQETVRLGLMAQKGLQRETLQAIAGKLDEEELEQLRACYARQLEDSLPLPVQLSYGGERQGEAEDDASFVI